MKVLWNTALELDCRDVWNSQTGSTVVKTSEPNKSLGAHSDSLGAYEANPKETLPMQLRVGFISHRCGLLPPAGTVLFSTKTHSINAILETLKSQRSRPRNGLFSFVSGHLHTGYYYSQVNLNLDVEYDRHLRHHRFTSNGGGSHVIEVQGENQATRMIATSPRTQIPGWGRGLMVWNLYQEDLAKYQEQEVL